MSLAPIRDAVISAVLALMMGIALAILTGAWSLKENKADHDADYLRLEAEMQRSLDVLCDAYKQVPRACVNQYPIYPRP